MKPTILFLMALLLTKTAKADEAYCYFHTCTDETVHFVWGPKRYSYIVHSYRPDKGEDYDATRALREANLIGATEFVSHIHIDSFADTPCVFPRKGLKAPNICALGAGRISFPVYSADTWLRTEELVIKDLGLSEYIDASLDSRIVNLEFKVGDKALKLGTSATCLFSE